MATKKATKKDKLLSLKQVKGLKVEMQKTIVKYTHYIDNPNVSSHDKVWLRKVRKLLITANDNLVVGSMGADYYRK